MSKVERMINIDWSILQGIASIGDLEIASKYAKELGSTMFFPESMPQEQIEQSMSAALKIMQQMEPQDPFEVQLIVQMISTHNTAMECLQRANINGQPFEGRDMNLKHANKFLRLYNEQLNTLNKHRGKGQQKITVQHVNVESGGQAMVGNIEANAPKKEQSGKKKATQPKAIEHKESDIIDMSLDIKSKEKVPIE